MPTNAIIEAFDAAGVDYEDILSIQRRLSSNTWVVTVRTAKAKEQVLSAWNFVIAGHRVFIADCDRKISLVKVYNAPNEMPDSVIIGRLSVYGSVLSFRRDLLTDSIFNGVRTARMGVKKHILSTVRIAGEFIRFSYRYPGQPKTCRRRGDLGHLTKECQSVRCFSCEQSGHQSEECEMPSLCSICRSADHMLYKCPYFCFSANVSVTAQTVQNTSTPSSYAGAAKAPRTVAFHSVLPSVASKPSEDQREKAKEKEKQVEKRRFSELSKESSRRSQKRGRESHERDHRDRDHERDPDRDRERERERERERGRERERERERYRDRSERSSDDDRRRSKDHGRSHRSQERSSESYDSDWTEVRHKSRDKHYHH